MIFQISPSNVTIFQPVWVLYNRKVLEFPYTFLLTFEILLNVSAMYYTLKLIWICSKIQVFHKNMSILMFNITVQWFEVFAANLVIKPYEIGVASLADTQSPLIRQWYTDNPSHYILLTVDPWKMEFSNGRFQFLIAGIIKWHYSASLVNLLFVLSIERIFACCFISDYEKKSRNWIITILLIFYHCMNIVTTFIYFLEGFDYFGLALMTLLPNIVAVFLFCLARQFNLKITRAQEMFSTPSYTLAARFQAKENIKYFQMIRNVVIMAMVLFFVVTVANLLILWNIVPEMDVLLNFIVQSIVNVTPIFTVPTLIHSVDSWRKFKMCPRFSFPMCSIISNKTKDRRKIGDITAQNETSLYFDQLNVLWS
uniref:Uncharacterized protein n=1 Tax=Caenorhabditis japonica TaxID=281687 RepID=A0A8R1ELT4_CAEJA